ncbi:unnamed protein product, partial [Gongylonema pulchrum]|uniref:Exportin-4 n=1 Tax=Gongylonema pulchrum TaxID=637853 RepID=A0A183DWK9_9BILA
MDEPSNSEQPVVQFPASLDPKDYSADQVTEMERMASVLMSPSSSVTPEARRHAEQFFVLLHETQMSPEYCRLVIESTTNEFVVFEMVQNFVSNIFRQWVLLEAPLVRQCFEYFFSGAVRHFRSNYRGSKLLRTEMLRACAKLLKRSIFDSKACDATTLDQTVHFLIANEDPDLQVLGCEYIEAIATEFGTSWRAANLGITFDFHLRARRTFEQRMCENFLRVAELVLSWNFEEHRFPIRISYADESSPAATLRPPYSWKEIFRSDNFLCIFFELHKRVRHKETMRTSSMNCLIQLSSLMGVVLMYEDPVDSAEPLGLLDSELIGVSLIIYKLITYHQIYAFGRIGEPFVK